MTYTASYKKASYCPFYLRPDHASYRGLDIIAQLIGLNIRAIGHKLNRKSGEFGSSVEWY